MAETVNLVILGASGDLTHRLLLPGLGTLLKAQPKRKVHLVGASAEELTQEQWQQRVTESVREGGCSADVVTRLVDGTRYVRIDATSAADLTSLLSGLSDPVVLYFALPPAVSMAACEALTTVPLPDDLRLAIEKPFGTDLSTARRFNHLLSGLAPEDRVFRVDHFLGKSTVLNLLGLRFTNRFFEPILNRDNVDRIDERDVTNYTAEPGVDAARNTETLAEVTVEVNSARWHGVPIRLRSGKALGDGFRAITVVFKDAFQPEGFSNRAIPNVLVIAMSNESVQVRLNTNGADDKFTLEQTVLTADLGNSPVRPYGEILAHIMDGDPLLSVRNDVAEDLWRILTPVMKAWDDGTVPMDTYRAGSSGPTSWR